MLFQALVSLLAAGSALANPVPRANTAGVTTLSSEMVTPWRELAFYSAAAYCSSDSIWGWRCGDSCSNIGRPSILTTGGNNQNNPYYFVANNGSHVIVSISGTNPFSPLSIANDLDFPMISMENGHFPGSGSAQVHGGFYKTFKRMVNNIDQAVAGQVNAGITNIIVTGHSLGAALGALTAVHLQKIYPQTNVVSRGFASPRVGNKAWANYVDATLGDRAQHMINFNDVIPQLPPREWGFQQSSNEIWINSHVGNSFVSCPGQENENCQNKLGLVGQVTSIAKYLSVAVHLGPYDGVWISNLNCKN